MSTISYTVGELKRIIKESKNEFDPKLGPNVMSDNKRNNEKSYKDAEKSAKDYDGGLRKEKKGELPEKSDGNRTTLDYNPRTDPGKDFKDKVDAQAKGYTSKLEMENGIEKAAEFDNDGKIKKYFSDDADKTNDLKKKLADSGIQGHNMKDENKKKNTMYENSAPKAKRLRFKNTKFLNESQMLSRIPEEYKIDGQKIYMKDAADNEYLVECTKSEATGIIETNVISYSNERVLSEQLDRVNQLFNYETNKDYAPATAKQRIAENSNFEDFMNLSRSLIK